MPGSHTLFLDGLAELILHLVNGSACNLFQGFLTSVLGNEIADFLVDLRIDFFFGNRNGIFFSLQYQGFLHEHTIQDDAAILFLTARIV